MFMLEKHSWQNPRSPVRSSWAEEGRGSRGKAGTQAGGRQLGDVLAPPPLAHLSKGRKSDVES